MNRKFILAILFIAIAITFCGTATAEEQNTIQDNQLNTNTITAVNDQSSPVQDNSIVDMSNTIQDTQSDTDPQTTDDQAANNEVTQNASLVSTMASTSDPIPEIVITFDDGFESAYTVAFPIMEQYGIKGTVYVVTGWVGAPGYLTQAQLTALHNAGWTIANHSYKHNYLQELSNEDVTTEIQTAITWLINNGFADGAYHLAYPYGSYNDNVIQMASQLGIKTARTTNGGTINPNGNINYLQLPIKYFDKDTTTDLWKASVDESISTKTTTIFLLHNVVATPSAQEDVSIDTFTAFIQYIAQTGVKTLTISPWYNEMMDNIAPEPSADLDSGSYNNYKTVNLSAVDNLDSNPLIYYTLDGSTPTTSSTLYTGPINFNTEGTTILKFIAVDFIGNISNVTERVYTIDKTTPNVATVDPANNAVNVLGNKVINITFNEALKVGSGWIELKNTKTGLMVPVTTSISGNTLTITPTSVLAKGVSYLVLIHTGSLTDLAGNSVAAYVSKFTTASALAVKSVDPANNAVNVPLNKLIKITFNQAIQTGSGWIELKNTKTGLMVPITTSISGNVLSITPKSTLAKGISYLVLIHTGSVKDLAGNPIAAYISKFTTLK